MRISRLFYVSIFLVSYCSVCSLESIEKEVPLWRSIEGISKEVEEDGGGRIVIVSQKFPCEELNYEI